MSVLEELRKEAASRKAREQAERRSAQTQQSALERELRSRMLALFRFLREMAENLNVVEPDVSMSYDVRGFGTLDGLRQSDYGVSTSDRRSLGQVTLGFRCRAEGVVKFQLDDKPAVERQRQYLWEHGLRFTCKSLADGSGVFFLDRLVPVSFDFVADPEKGLIRLRTRNFEVLGPSTVSYAPEQIGEDLMDELAKAILRKPSRFNELSGNTLSDEQRERLRQRLADDPRRVEVVEPAGADDHPPAAAAGKRGLLRALIERSKAGASARKVS